ncbi:MAG: glycosyltransferase [Thermoanaerobaculales bacterium]|jgi:glycosyltransferase involved in cell wall biosynthesis|nr:glycosyltransferase [Thermoanaerobaculales bacterium]
MRILLVSSRFPLPPWRGNQLRTVQWLEALAGHELRVVCPDPDGRTLPPGLGAELVAVTAGRSAAAAGLATALFRGRPAQEGLYATAEARRRLTGALRERRPDLVIVQMVRCAWAAEVADRETPGLPLLFDAIDSMTLHYQRAASLASPAVAAALRIEADRCRRREGWLVARAALTTAVGARDLAALAAGSRGVVVPVTGGVAVDRREPTAGGPTVLLSGNLGYRPTVEAARRFADTVWPELRRRVPGARWVLAGARPAAALRRLAALPGVELHGDVDDLAPFLARATVAVAPMAGGSGVPIKILEAMAAGVPVVADPWAAAGLAEAGAVAEADTPARWVEAVATLLTDSHAAGIQAARGAAVWQAHYHPDRVRGLVRDAVAAAAGTAP